MINIREITREDIPHMEKLLRDTGLAFEEADPIGLKIMFDDGSLKALVGYDDDTAFAVCVYSYSAELRTFRKKAYVEYLYVRPDHRNIGIGTLMLKNFSRIAVNNGCSEISWVCPSENGAAHSFSVKSGAEKLAGTDVFSVSGAENLEEFGKFTCSCCGKG